MPPPVQALRYLSCLKTLSHHLDGEKRRLRRRQLDLQTCLAAARKGHTFLSRLEPLPPSQPVPRLVTQVGFDRRAPFRSGPQQTPRSRPNQSGSRRIRFAHTYFGMLTFRRMGKEGACVLKHSTKSPEKVSIFRVN